MPDVLIGNFKGPQGETGPANKLLATVYQFCESDDGQKIPDGPWLDECPEIKKGKFYWCRNTMTWEEGEDSVLYSVGYVGMDGEFTGTDLVEALSKRVDALENRTLSIDKGGTGSTTLDGAQAKLGITQLRTDMQTADKELGKRIDGINDYTTGINLIRGSRDFRQGTERITPGANRYYDGFDIGIGNVVSVDNEGFMNITLNTVCVSSLLLAESTTYTGFVDVEINKPLSDSDYLMTMCLFRLNPAGSVNQTTSYSFTYADYKKECDSAKSGEWQQIKLTKTFTIPNDENKYFVTVFYNNCIIRKPGLLYGSINHPIYAPNPNDVDYINDITSMPNLLRGSRDLIESTENIPGTTNRPMNGWHLNSSERIKGDDGFTYMHLTTQGSKDTCIHKLPLGKSYTAFFDFMCQGVAGLTNQNILSFYVIDTKNSSILWKIENVNLATLGLTSVNNGEWYNVHYSFTIPELETDDWFFIYRVFYNYTTSGTSVNYKKPGLYPGCIENPAWDVNPFDVASNYEWDLGAPLLLGDRTKIAEGTDLNDIKKFGSYSCLGATVCNTLKNCPITNVSFVLDVMSPTGDKGNTQPQQRIRKWSYPFEEYMRIYNASYDNKWSEWIKTVNNQQQIGYEQGGTNSNSLAGAKSNLGITALETRVKTLEDQLAALTS